MSSQRRQDVILVVDDTPEILRSMQEILRDHYIVKAANNGERALVIAQGSEQINLILLDVMMPGVDGYQICRQLKQDKRTQDIPVIFLTARDDSDAEKYGFDVGAVDYITKPISPPTVLARIHTHLQLKASADFLRDKNAYLELEIEKRTQEVELMQEVVFLGLASLAESRHSETGYHIRRTQLYLEKLAEQLKDHQRFAGALHEYGIDMLVKAAPLHDIGKVGIPDKILLKPERLTLEEFEVMKRHTVIGRDTIENAERQLGKSVKFLNLAKENAYYHHEKWDGTGYPEGLAGEDIPVCARLLAVADVYDALISKRVYKKAIPHAVAVRMIRKCRGTYFDPDVVDAFLEIQQEFMEISETYDDN
jgi:putative two-component system response regulator